MGPTKKCSGVVWCSVCSIALKENDKKISVCVKVISDGDFDGRQRCFVLMK